MNRPSSLLLSPGEAAQIARELLSEAVDAPRDTQRAADLPGEAKLPPSVTAERIRIGAHVTEVATEAAIQATIKALLYSARFSAQDEDQAVAAVFADIRQRRLLKLLFAESDDRGDNHIGYVAEPIDLETQIETVTAWVRLARGVASSSGASDHAVEQKR